MIEELRETSRPGKLFASSKETLELELLHRFLRLSAEERLRLLHLLSHGAGELPSLLVEEARGTMVKGEDPGRLVPDSNGNGTDGRDRLVFRKPGRSIHVAESFDDDVAVRLQHFAEDTSTERETS